MCTACASLHLCMLAFIFWKTLSTHLYRYGSWQTSMSRQLQHLLSNSGACEWQRCQYESQVATFCSRAAEGWSRPNESARSKALKKKLWLIKMIAWTWSERQKCREGALLSWELMEILCSKAPLKSFGKSKLYHADTPAIDLSWLTAWGK